MSSRYDNVNQTLFVNDMTLLCYKLNFLCFFIDFVRNIIVLSGQRIHILHNDFWTKNHFAQINVSDIHLPPFLFFKYFVAFQVERNWYGQLAKVT